MSVPVRKNNAHVTLTACSDTPWHSLLRSLRHSFGQALSNIGLWLASTTRHAGTCIRAHGTWGEKPSSEVIDKLSVNGTARRPARAAETNTNYLRILPRELYTPKHITKGV